MFDYAKAIDDVRIESLANGLQIIANSEAIDSDPNIEERYIKRIIDKAMTFAYNKRKGMNRPNEYPFSKFENEADTFHNIIVNMAYTALTRRGSEGQTSHTENGTTRVYTFSGLYLLSDVDQIPELAGI